MMRLLTESCKAEAQKALQYEGAITMQLSFQILGQVAGQEMMSSAEVVAGMPGLKKYVDENRLKELMKSQ